MVTPIIGHDHSVEPARPDDVYAAVSWSDTGFEIAVAGDGAVESFPADRVADVRRHLDDLRVRFGDRLACVVESTNGMLDGGLMSAGFRVYRIDPHSLPARPVLGSVSAEILARVATQRPEQLTRLVLDNGSLTGRFPEVEQYVADAAGDLAALAAASRCVTRGAPAGGAAPTVALTFDDGPHPPFTEAVLDTLATYAVPATFFCVGLHAQAHPQLVRRMAAEGHQLGNHTWSHPLLIDLDGSQTRAQLDRTDDHLAAATAAAGGSDRLLFRPPYGAISRQFLQRFRDDPTDRTMVLWDVEPYDWAQPGTDVIAQSVLADVTPGSIVLLHDGGGDRSQTVQSLPRIVEGLLERGYSFVTVGAMLSV